MGKVGAAAVRFGFWCRRASESASLAHSIHADAGLRTDQESRRGRRVARLPVAVADVQKAIHAGGAATKKRGEN